MHAASFVPKLLHKLPFCFRALILLACTFQIACTSLPAPERQAQLDAQSQALAEQLRQRWQTHPLLQAYEKHLRQEGGLAQRHALAGQTFLIVPGWLHQSQKTTGADLARQRLTLTALGAEVYLANVDENAAVEANAQIVLQDLQQLAQTHDSITVLSASKGGAEAALALSAMAQLMPATLLTRKSTHASASASAPIRSHWSQRIKAWVNIGGTLRGTALADHALDWRLCWLVSGFLVPGGSMEGIRSLSPKASAARHASLQLPAHLQVVNLLGIAKAQHISERGKQGYRLLSELGPNDGITLLDDALVESAPTVVLHGADHYFLLPDLDTHTTALALALAQTFNPSTAP